MITSFYTAPKIQFGGKIPMKNYKGPILQLTKDETEKIAKIQDNISQLEIERYKILQFFEGKHISYQQYDYYANTLNLLEYRIEQARELIREIKVNRFTIQKNNTESLS